LAGRLGSVARYPSRRSFSESRDRLLASARRRHVLGCIVFGVIRPCGTALRVRPEAAVPVVGVLGGFHDLSPTYAFESVQLLRDASFSRHRELVGQVLAGVPGSGLAFAISG